MKIDNSQEKKIQAEKWGQEGLKLVGIGKLDEAIDVFNKVKKEDSPLYYAIAKLNLGEILESKGNIKEAILAYQEVEGTPVLRARAQLRLGNALYKKGEFENGDAAFNESISESDKVIDEYKKKGEDYQRYFDQAQIDKLNIGVMLSNYNNLDKAIKIWDSVELKSEYAEVAQLYISIAKGGVR